MFFNEITHTSFSDVKALLRSCVSIDRIEGDTGDLALNDPRRMRSLSEDDRHNVECLTQALNEYLDDGRGCPNLRSQRDLNRNGFFVQFYYCADDPDHLSATVKTGENFVHVIV